MKRLKTLSIFGAISTMAILPGCTPLFTSCSCHSSDSTHITITYDAGSFGWFDKKSIHTKKIKVEKNTEWQDVEHITPTCDAYHAFKFWKINGHSIDDDFIFNKNTIIIAEYDNVQPVTDGFELETTDWKITTGPAQRFNTTNIIWKGSDTIELGRSDEGAQNYIYCSDFAVIQGSGGPSYEDVGLVPHSKHQFEKDTPKSIPLSFAFSIPSTPFVAIFNMKFVWQTQTSETKSQTFLITLHWNC